MANGSFNRILKLLRTERGMSQKDAAASLGVSQALLSHYENGIRECGLDFVVRAAEFYDVSCDYLLGRSPDRSGLTLMVEDIPDADSKDDKKYKGSVLPTLNKKLISNSLNVLYDMLQNSKDKTLISEVSNYLMLAVYKMFRLVFAANPKNKNDMFRLSKATYSGYADAGMSVSEANAGALLVGESVKDKDSAVELGALEMTTESLSKNYPLYATSLLNLIQLSEKSVERDPKKK